MMTILPLIALVIVVAALAGVWRARGRGPATMQSSIVLLIVSIIAVVGAWLVLYRR